jgi:RNA polymerase sigma-70 factor (ECF subfamily)
LATFEKNVEAAIPALRRYARALTRDSEVADDLVEHTLLQAIRSKHLFRDGVVRDWLYSVLIKLNRDRLLSLARRPTLSPIKGNGSAGLTAADAGGQDIERALSALVEEQRNALLLVVLEGLTYSEVAEVQGVPIGTVMSRVALARDAVKNALEGLARQKC